MKLKNQTINLGLSGYDELFMTEQERADTRKPKVEELPLSELTPFKDHPFKVKNDAEMAELMKSIADAGVLSPALARPKEGGGYELISGHRRLAACKALGMDTMPVIVRKLTDEEAVITMVDSNLQREHILPSEKAFAYKMKMEALKSQGKRTDLTSTQLGPKLRSNEIVGAASGDSREQVRRYIRLTNLIPEILQMVDDGKIALTPAVELSYLQPSEQETLFSTMDCDEVTPSLSQAQRLRRMSEEQRFTDSAVMQLMSEVKGNQVEYVPPADKKESGELSADMLFADFMELWLEVVRNSIEKTTFSSYTQMVKGKIVPYFRDTGVKLGELQARHIQSFYLYELKTVSASTVIHEHANIHKALKYAVKMDLIPYNPADKVERPKKQKYIADYYRLEELEQLFEATKDHPYSLLIQITAFYGLRRSEALGLRWDAIDFERNTITIRHIVTNAKIDGKYEIIREDRAKTKSSLRSLPLVGNIREKLLALKEQQKENKRICGNCYNREYDGYVFVDVMGNIFNPRNLSSNFSKLLEMNGLRHIRFHDLRHILCFSLFKTGSLSKSLFNAH